ncbi:MAG: DNA polymerase III subunit alpha [Myxococcales bacterium FL481]|nr:MAG: DNA polymerase III subunit alpha [Myxococcales bacterium FL481]
MTGESYAALWCKSNYSFLEGASHPDELVEQAHSTGIRSLALCDRDGVYGVVRAHVRALELGLHLIVGAQVSVDDGTSIVLLAQSRSGYTNLCRLLTVGRRRCEKGASQVTWREVSENAGDLVALWGGPNSRITAVDERPPIIEEIRDAFALRLYTVVSRHQRAQDAALEQITRERAGRYGLTCVAANEVLYHQPDRRALQDVLTCVRHGVSLPKAGRLLKGNDEHDLKSPYAFVARFSDCLPDVRRGLEIAEQCTFSLGQLRYVYPEERLPAGSTASSYLRDLVILGAQRRFPQGVPESVWAQVDRELEVIGELDYGGYFLTMHEVVRFCREQNILCQGRGSAANSVVCYLLEITAVDPVRMDLLFERFISRERAEPPDIDLDIEHERREEVIQHMYGKYGRDRAAMVANMIRYRPKSAIRDVGKALGISETALDRAAKLVGRYEAVEPDPVVQAGLDMDVPMHEHLVRLANEILDFPRHLSIHPGGFLLGHEPVHDIVPIENATMANRTVIQWDKDDIEELGLFKVDLLGLGALTLVHRCFDAVRAHHGRELSMATLPVDDGPTYDMICRGDTVGVFQIESRAQMSMLPRLQPRNFYDLVIEVSIVRPGPISGKMVHPYLRRRNKLEKVVYPHPSLEPVLRKTLGVPLFQEQVMRLAVVAADYTPGESDQLRRDMAAWRRSGRIATHRQRLIERMTKKGIEAEFAERVFEQIQGFGEYGFPESHAASFALIVYATSWLRRHHMPEFTASLLNAQPMGFYSPATIVDDAKRHGVEIRPVCVVRSDWDCTLERREDGHLAVRMGLRYIKGLHESVATRLLMARSGEKFVSLEDCARRSQLDRGNLVRLAEAGAYDGFGVSRREALWEVRRLEKARHDDLVLSDVVDHPAFSPLSALEDVAWDYRASGHSVRAHPLEPLRPQLEAMGLPDARTLGRKRSGTAVDYAGIVICRQRPGTAAGVTFMTLEDETGFVNVVIWRRVFEQYAVLVKSAAFLGLSGELQVESGVCHLVAEKLWRPQLGEKPVVRGSRDFH